MCIEQWGKFNFSEFFGKYKLSKLWNGKRRKFSSKRRRKKSWKKVFLLCCLSNKSTRQFSIIYTKSSSEYTQSEQQQEQKQQLTTKMYTCVYRRKTRLRAFDVCNAFRIMNLAFVCCLAVAAATRQACVGRYENIVPYTQIRIEFADLEWDACLTKKIVTHRIDDDVKPKQSTHTSKNRRKNWINEEEEEPYTRTINERTTHVLIY